MIKILDNVISQKYQDHLENTFLGREVEWIFNKNLTFEENGNCGFVHSLMEGEYTSNYYNYLIPLLCEISEKSEVNFTEICLGRSFLQLPSISKHNNDLFHVDLIDLNHKVFLYYVNDADGDTLISSERYNKNKNQFYGREYEFDILERISPKKGRVVIFDGDYYHAAGIPKKNNRCVINFDVSE